MTHEAMNRINAHIQNLCYNKDIMLSRWLKGTGMELLKELDNYNVDRPRTIVLMEADFNMNCKLMGRRILQQMQDHEDNSE